jgi:hypothetical protein
VRCGLRGRARPCPLPAPQVSLDLASFEVVRACAGLLLDLLHERLLDLVFCNEQEAAALAEVRAPRARDLGVMITLRLTLGLPTHGPDWQWDAVPWQECAASRAACPPRLLRSRTWRRPPQWCEFESWPRQSERGGGRRAAGRRRLPAGTAAQRPVLRRLNAGRTCMAQGKPAGLSG